MDKQFKDKSDVSEQVAYPTQTSRYDEVNAWLVAGNLLCGFLFVVLLLVWVFGERPFQRVHITLGPSKHLKANEKAQLAEGPIDFPDTTKVAFERMQEALPRLDQIIADIGATQASDGRGQDGLGGIGGGGDQRLPEVPTTVPAYQRWQIKYSVGDIDQYRKQLDFFGIEIGVVHAKANRIVRVSQLSTKTKLSYSTRQAENENNSLYFVHKDGRVKLWGQSIAKAAGASLTDALTVEFFPSQTSSQLAKVESMAVQQAGRSLKEVVKTEFRIVEVDGEYKFVVHNINYR